MKRNISHSAVLMTAAVLGLLLGAAGAFAEPLIQEFTNLIDARQSADWTNLAGREIELEGLDGEQDVVKIDEPKAAGYFYTYEYPTLIGNDAIYGGYSAQTCEYNKLYYQRDYKHYYQDNNQIWKTDILDLDLYRCNLRIQVY